MSQLILGMHIRIGSGVSAIGILSLSIACRHLEEYLETNIHAKESNAQTERV
ncbi:MAG TPA: hypothetical protein VJW94_20085 [Candidatus Acidoferrum sp.]|nr:hypothetical protein [Candidatus Acidoferrum sp.]